MAVKKPYTIVTWLWRPKSAWKRNYTHEHVNALYASLKQHTSVPIRLVCITDMPEGIECETLPLPAFDFVDVNNGGPNCYIRLWLFSKEAKKALKANRVLCIDLDVDITGNIDDIIKCTDDFKINHKADSIRHYNGSLWSHKLGTMTNVWEDFDINKSPQEAQFRLDMRGIRAVGSDQSYLTHKIKNAPVWGQKDGIYHIWHVGTDIPENCRIMFYSGDNKYKHN